MHRHKNSDGSGCDHSITKDLHNTTDNKEKNCITEINVEDVTILKHPVITLKYFLFEALLLMETFSRVFLCSLWLRLLHFKYRIICAIIFIFMICFLYKFQYSNALIFNKIFTNMGYFLKWGFLGLLSSIGFGFGFHTFILYLSPFIATVTLAAWECKTVDFPEPYPEKIICPNVDYIIPMSVWKIASKIMWEAYFWGLGSAIGELPPYLIAFASSPTASMGHSRKLSTVSVIHIKTKEFLTVLIRKAGFIGILLCASIPNPFYDFAGIVCGFCRIPFLTFFGATLIGKSIIKVSIMSFFVILCFSPSKENIIVKITGHIPFIGDSLSHFLNDTISYNKLRFHSDMTSKYQSTSTIFHKITNLIMTITFVCFMISFINNLAKSYAKRSKH